MNITLIYYKFFPRKLLTKHMFLSISSNSGVFFPQPGGFTVEVVNNNSSMVMTGMRVQVGTQAIERAPSYIEIFGRTMQMNLTRSRWFDLPFTREEALQADKKLSIFSKEFSSFIFKD